MHMRNFAIQSLFEHDLLRLKRVPTGDNSSDELNKHAPRVLFIRHTDYIIGQTNPQYMAVHSTVL